MKDSMKTRLNLPIFRPAAPILIKLKITLTIFAIIACMAISTRAEIPSIFINTPPDIKPVEEPESYGPDTLWKKINGQAEFYLPAGFEQLKSQLFVAMDNADMFIEVNLYDMGNLANAFSVFSLQQRDNAKPIDVTPMAYQTENAVYLVHGPYYVEVISMVPLDEHMILLHQLASQFVKETPVQATGMEEINRFPQENQIKGSANLIPRDAFGYDRLDKVFTLAYQLGQDEVVAFISKRQSAADAAKLVDGLYAFYKDFGAKDIKQNTTIKGARLIEIMGTYEFMFSIENYVAGVHEAPTQKQAENLARKLAESLQNRK